MIGSTGVYLVDRQDVRRAPEATDPLDAADEARAVRRLHSAQFARRRAGADELRELLVDRAFHAIQVAARLRGRANHELPAHLAEIDVGRDIGGGLFVIDEPLVEP